MNSMLVKLKGFLRALGKGQMGLATIPTIVGAVSTLAIAGTIANTVISQGTEATDDVEQAVHEAIQSVQSTCQIKGSLIGIAATAPSDASIGQLTFTLALVSSRGFIDFTPPVPSADNNGLADPISSNTVVISYNDEFQNVENLYWTVDKLGKNDDDNMLEVNELFQITIGGNPVPGKNGGNLVDALGKDLSRDTNFHIKLKVAQGAGLDLERRTPPYIPKIVNFGY